MMIVCTLNALLKINEDLSNAKKINKSVQNKGVKDTQRF